MKTLAATQAVSTLLVVIDSNLSDYQTLVAGVVEGAQVLVLDTNQDGIAQITQFLHSLPQQPASTLHPFSLHILSHGRSGCLQLGNVELNSKMLTRYAMQLQQWSVYLGTNAEIWLYGCEVAAGKVGRAFVAYLSELIGATIAASDTVTGNPAGGGNWNLEVRTGEIRSPLVFTTETCAVYAGTLPLGFNKTDFVTGTSPVNISAEDFDGDGKFDLAVANYDSDSVSVLLNNGSGSFLPKTDFATGAKPSDVSVGDFNGDGKFDLAVANYDSDSVSVLLNNGSGSFLPKTDFATGLSPRGVRVGDFNGDSKLDLIVANRNANTISLLLGNGDGTFLSKTDFATGMRPASVSVGDFNQDDKLDVVVANFSAGTASVLLGDGSGSFSAKTDFATGARPSGISVADFNGDGKPDLVIANRNPNTVSVLLGDGAGGFPSKTDFATGTRPVSVGVGDFDGDSKLDLAVANFDANSVSLLLGDGSGSFSAKTDFATGTRPASLSVKDFNGDGKADIAITNYDSNTVSLLLSTTSFAPTVTLPGQNISYTENGAIALLDPTATVTDNSANFNSGNLTVRFSNGGIASDRLAIVSGGNITLDGRTVKVGGTEIGTYTGGIGTQSLVIAFNTNATPASTQELLRQIGYFNTSESLTASSRTVEIVIDDGTGNISTPVTKTINLTSVNDAPIIGTTTILYDGSLGTTPDQQNWTYISVPSGVTPTASNGTTNLNSSSNSGFLAGFSRADQILDASQGFVISFSAEVLSEAIETTADKNGDGKSDRAGFSLVVVTQDKTKAIELGFNTTVDGLKIFAQEDGTSQANPSQQPTATSPENTRTLFTQAEAVDISLIGMVNYSLAVSSNIYTLYANDTAILTGKLRDYTAFAGFPDPYETPNFIFFGDDTTSARANVNLGSVKLLTNTALPARTGNEDEALTITDLLIDDWDAEAANLTVTLSVTQGTLTITSVSGTTVTNSGSSTVTLTGTRSQISKTLAEGNLTYQGKLNFNGTDTLTVKAADNGASGGAAQTTTKTMQLTVTAVQDAPTAADNAITTVENTVYTFGVADFKFADADTTDSLQKVKITQLPQTGSLTLNGKAVSESDEITVANIAAGDLQFTPDNDAIGDDYANFQFQVSDGQGYSSSHTITISVSSAGNAPTISGTPATSVDEDSAYSFIPTASDNNGDTLTFDIANQPIWTSFNFTTGELSGTPTNENVGVYSNIVISVRDGKDAVALPAFTLTVVNINDAPTLTNPIADQTSQVNTTFKFAIPLNTFEDVDAVDTLKLSAVLENDQSLPNWLQFDTSTGTFSGTPTDQDIGTLKLKITATDKAGVSISDIFALTVQNSVGQNPVQSGQSGQSGETGGTEQSGQSGQPGQPTQPNRTGQLTKPNNETELGMKTGIPTPEIQISRKMQVHRKGTQKADRLRGGLLTSDRIQGLDGDDRISGGIGRARARQDRLYGEGGNDQLFGGNGQDLLDGGDGNDKLFGGKGRDLVQGDTGNDRLLGEKGDDILIGGQGEDTLTGGNGRDMFVFESLSEAEDVITDFEISQDVIDLRKIFAAPAFSGSTPFARFKQFVRLEQANSGIAVQIDADGGGSGTSFTTLVTLNGVSSLNSTHFVIA